MSTKVQIAKTLFLVMLASALLTAAFITGHSEGRRHPSWEDVDACADALRECRASASTPPRQHYAQCIGATSYGPVCHLTWETE